MEKDVPDDAALPEGDDAGKLEEAAAAVGDGEDGDAAGEVAGTVAPEQDAALPEGDDDGKLEEASPAVCDKDGDTAGEGTAAPEQDAALPEGDDAGKLEGAALAVGGEEDRDAAGEGTAAPEQDAAFPDGDDAGKLEQAFPAVGDQTDGDAAGEDTKSVAPEQDATLPDGYDDGKLEEAALAVGDKDGDAAGEDPGSVAPEQDAALPEGDDDGKLEEAALAVCDKDGDAAGEDAGAVAPEHQVVAATGEDVPSSGRGADEEAVGEEYTPPGFVADVGAASEEDTLLSDGPDAPPAGGLHDDEREHEQEPVPALRQPSLAISSTAAQKQSAPRKDHPPKPARPMCRRRQDSGPGLVIYVIAPAAATAGQPVLSVEEFHAINTAALRSGASVVLNLPRDAHIVAQDSQTVRHAAILWPLMELANTRFKSPSSSEEFDVRAANLLYDALGSADAPLTQEDMAAGLRSLGFERNIDDVVAALFTTSSGPRDQVTREDFCSLVFAAEQPDFVAVCPCEGGRIDDPFCWPYARKVEISGCTGVVDAAVLSAKVEESKQLAADAERGHCVVLVLARGRTLLDPGGYEDYMRAELQAVYSALPEHWPLLWCPGPPELGLLPSAASGGSRPIWAMPKALGLNELAGWLRYLLVVRPPAPTVT